MKIKSIKFDYEKRELIIVHDVKIHGNTYRHDKILQKEVPVIDSFVSETDKIITFEFAEELGLINITEIEKFIDP